MNPQVFTTLSFTIIFAPSSSSKIESGGDHTLFLELFNDKIVFVAPAAYATACPTTLSSASTRTTKGTTGWTPPRVSAASVYHKWRIFSLDEYQII